MTTETAICSKAYLIAGCLWEDRDRSGSLSEQLLAVANSPAHGTDGDLTDNDRAALRELAQEAVAP